MRVKYLFFVLLLWGFGVGIAEAATREGEPDASYRESRTFRIEPSRDGGFSLESDVEIGYTYRSERSTQNRVFFVPEPFYAEVSKLRGEFRDRRLDGDRIGVEVPEFQDIFMTSGRVHVLEFPEDAQPGDVARYSYRESYRDVAYMPLLYVPNADHVVSYEVVIEHPDDVEVDFSFFFPREELTPEIDRLKRDRTVLRFRDLHGGDELPYFPFNGFQAAVLVQATHDGTPITPTPAAAFSTWYRTLVGDLDMADLAALAATLEKESPRETVAAIHDYVRSSIRYVADERDENAIIPRDPGTVISNGYGDCKDRAFLVTALARELGIDVSVVLVSTEPTPVFEGTHVALYNHVISVFEDEAGRVFFDPTHRHVPFGALPESDVDAPALVIGEGTGELLRVPAPETEPLLDIVVTGSLDAPEAARAEVTVRGDYAAELYRIHAEERAIDVENFLSISATEPLHKLSLDHFLPVAIDPHEATFAADADLSGFVVASPTRRYVPHTPFRTVDPVVMERAEDDHALHFWDRPYLRLALDLETPGFAAADEALAVGEDGPLAFEASMTSPEAARTRIEYVLRQSAKRLHGEAKAQYLDAAKQYLDARRGMFILRPVDDAEAENVDVDTATTEGRP